MKRSTKLLITASTTAALAGALSYSAAKLISDGTLNREEPTVMKKLKGIMYSSAPEYRLSQKIKTDLFGEIELLRSRETETPTIVSRDGVLLNAHWVPHPNPKRNIVAMHGWRSSWTHDFCSISSFWYDSGCSVLYPDQRGQQGSGGDYMSFGMLERFDCLDWVDWVNGKCGGLPVYLAGVSMGATSVLMASELELPPNLRGIIADCGFTTPDAIWRHVAKSNLHIPYVIQGGIVDEMCRRKLNLSSKSCSTLEALKNAKVPVLFIHGTADRLVPVEMTYKNYLACSSPKKLLIVPGASHGMSYITDKKAYRQALREFWSDYDLL